MSDEPRITPPDRPARDVTRDRPPAASMPKPPLLRSQEYEASKAAHEMRRLVPAVILLGLAAMGVVALCGRTEQLAIQRDQCRDELRAAKVHGR